MTGPEEHRELADDLDHEADRMGERSEKLEAEIDDTRQEWESKQRDGSVPGAPPPEGQEGDLDEGEVGDRGPAQAP